MEMVHLLLKAIENVDAENNAHRTALMVAATHNRVQATVALLNKGAIWELRSNANKTTMDIAREFGQTGVIQVLQAHQLKMNTRKFILFLDGGARGNPGPGGAGAVLVEIFPFKKTTSILYIGSVALNDPSTASNGAEYHALLTGLKAALVQGFHGIHMVGGSEIIIRQMEENVPRAPHLRDFYFSCQIMDASR